MSLVKVESSEGITTITMTRAEKRNALTQELCDGLYEAYRAFEAGQDKVAILQADGSSFCVGADLHNPPPAMWKAVPDVSHKLSKPVIAATQGWVIGGGICMVMTCDLMVSADTTKFMYPEAKVGVFGGLMPGIVSRMPHKVAMELLLLGEEIPAKRAYDVGFVNKIVPQGEERKEARRMASVIANSAPLVIRTLRDFANQTLPKGPAEIFVPERYKLEQIANSEDRKEGAAAFREKRPAQFKGR
ncbi:Enoyl-CoA hydratase/carnithine racemase [Enhydrobacter aerosaccus]|uniref:Enoyl-CoA hydratase/carnithine racemase n=1 Tax=Enhydrobacter aerosaccus TaxID=225324 RepID=A0A1T4P9B0_9HYPH|nr:enoyl-CoA hydratase-related protein [Enhydrobacter aerosaccus]SJZ88072.1 Enoyl-CoA hydratase/carnithine racemase [Enhydrobacter aerosaccus]